jgi:hypothetical protein
MIGIARMVAVFVVAVLGVAALATMVRGIK